MYIKRIILKNIRGFEELDFDLTRADGSYAGWTVFTGDNGSGKSALLKAIAVGLVGKEKVRALQPSFQQWIRDGADSASIQLDIVEKKHEDFYAHDEFDAAFGAISSEPELRYSKLKIELDKMGMEIRLREDRTEHYSYNYCTIPPFTCGYGPFRRVFGASSEATRRMVADETKRFVTLFDESASLAEADNWLQKLNYQSLEGKKIQKQQLKVLRDILNDELLPNQIRVDRVDSDGLWLKDRNNTELAWSDMSDGYRSALALLTDILRHLMEDIYIDEDFNGKTLADRSGVVLIDEIDAHLHPEWQQKIGFWLKKHFPNIQFIVTTHSPIICQAADDNGLFVLPEPGSQDKPKALSKEEYNKVIASRPDTILLTSAFGLEYTRSPRAVEGRIEYAKLKSKRRAGAQLTLEEEARMGELEVFGENEEEL